MEKFLPYPSRSACTRSILAHMEWKVLAHTPAQAPSSREMRSFISAAALFVKVIASILCGGTPFWTSAQMRAVSTRVLPLPAPAMTSTAPSVSRTAASWLSFRPKSFCIVE